MIVSLTVLTYKSKPVLLSQWLHLIAIDSTFSPLHYVYIKTKAVETLQKPLIIKVLLIYLFQWYLQYATQWIEKETIEFFLYADWPVCFSIMMINLFLSEGLLTLALFFHTLEHQDWVSILVPMQDDWYNLIRVKHMY